MASKSNVSPRIDRCIPSLVQRDRPMMAELDAKLAQQTEILAYRSSGNQVNHQYTNICYKTRIAIPFASLTSTGSYSDFSMRVGGVSQSVVGYPFRLTETYQGILAAVTICSAHRYKFKIRLQSRTLTDTVATSTGDEAIVDLINNESLVGIVAAGGPRGTTYKSGTITCRIDNPTLPAAGTRRVLVVPQVQTDVSFQPGFDVSGQSTVYISSISIIDYPDEKIGW